MRRHPWTPRRRPRRSTTGPSARELARIAGCLLFGVVVAGGVAVLIAVELFELL